MLSSDQTLRDMVERAIDYRELGVEHIWAIDPWKRLGFEFLSGLFQQPADVVLRIPGTPVEVSLAEIFTELDES